MNPDLYPRPVQDPDTAPFWEYCQRGELRIQRCTACGRYRHFPRPRCPSCQSDAVQWARCAGTGTIHSWTVCHRPVLPAFDDLVPYNVVVVQLAEGPFMVSNLVGTTGEPVIGMPVTVCFTTIDDRLTIPQFRPSGP